MAMLPKGSVRRVADGVIAGVATLRAEQFLLPDPARPCCIPAVILDDALGCSKGSFSAHRGSCQAGIPADSLVLRGCIASPRRKAAMHQSCTARPWGMLVRLGRETGATFVGMVVLCSSGIFCEEEPVLWVAGCLQVLFAPCCPFPG